MQRTLIFIVGLILLLLSAGCGGSGEGGGPTFPFTGVYSGALTAGGVPATIVVSIDGSGVTDAVLANSTGVLLSGSGTTTTAGQITVAMTGSAGPTTLTGNFPLALTRAASSGPNLDLSGGVNSSGVPTSKAGTTSLYKGKYSIEHTGSASGGFKINISSAGKVYLIEGSNQTLIGSVGPTGSITFEGPGLVVPSSTVTVWTGKLFVSPSSSGGSGKFEQKSNPGFSGSWGAVPEAPITPIFNQTSIVQGLRPSDSITILATSPNGHMVGFSDSKATFWETPDAAPVELSNPGSTTITWMTSVNSAGAKVGYSYVASGGVGNSLPVYWAPNSTSPVVLALPDEYVTGLASGINDGGDIVGLARKSDGSTRPCIWPRGGAQPFIPPQGDTVTVSNGGVIFCPANKAYLPSLDAQKVISIVPFGGYGQLNLVSMNPNAAVTGMGQFMDDGLNHPLYWTTVTAPGTALKFIAAYKEMRPNSAGINGGIIGTARYASNNSPQAVFWSDTQTVHALDDIVKDNTAVLKYGIAVFADKSVVAQGTLPSGVTATLYLRP